MHAVVLAGGKGTRLRPFTTTLPKPLVPIGTQHSILDVILFQLAASGVTHVTLPIGYLGHLIRSFVGDGSRWGLDVTTVEEDRPLGTIGPLLPILDELPPEVLVMNGDTLTDLPYADFVGKHRAGGHRLSVATYRRTTPIDFGVLDVTEEGITGFREKPTVDVLVSMGVYVMSTDLLRRYPPGMSLGFDVLMHDLIAAGDFPASHTHDGFWLDIGRPEDYDQANAEAEALLDRLLPGAGRWSPGGAPLVVAPPAVLRADTVAPAARAAS